MGMRIYTSTGTFVPGDYGLAIGDIVNVVCVGGGGGSRGLTINGGAGGTSSFGALLSASGGSGGGNGTAATGGMGNGAVGNTNYAAGGAGGYLPGVPLFGGNGGQGGTTVGPAGLAGGSVSVTTVVSPYFNPLGNGNCGATGGTGSGAGNGYGAGAASDKFYNNISPSSGGAGYRTIESFKLTSLDTITVTVGLGGTAGTGGAPQGYAGAPGVVVVTW